MKPDPNRRYPNDTIVRMPATRARTSTHHLATSALRLGDTLSAPGIVRSVELHSATPAPPQTNWAMIAPVIQDVVDAADQVMRFGLLPPLG
jgi:hypothetical protein